MFRFLKPFEQISHTNKTIITLSWILCLFTLWFIIGIGDGTHLVPTMSQVFHGFISLYNEGLVVHIFSSLALCFKSVIYAVIVSLIIAYTFPIPILKPISILFSKLRYLPLTGISFYITILITDAREIQVWVLVIFMITFLITSLISMIKDISDEEFDHAKTLGCTRWEILWEVIIKGRFDYVIEAIRANMAIVWVMLITAESILVASGGIGVLIKNNDRLGDFGKVIALQIIIILIGLSLDFILTKFRKLVFRYSKF